MPLIPKNELLNRHIYPDTLKAGDMKSLKQMSDRQISQIILCTDDRGYLVKVKLCFENKLIHLFDA